MEWQRSAVCRSNPDLWTVERSHHIRAAEAAEACSWCPALQPCRDYAAGFAWSGVVIAGWVAGREPRQPPWA